MLWPEGPRDARFHHSIEGRKQPHSCGAPQPKEDPRRPFPGQALLHDLGSLGSTTSMSANCIAFICNFQCLNFQWVSIIKSSPLYRRNLTCKRALSGDLSPLASSLGIIVYSLLPSSLPPCSWKLPYFREHRLLSTFQKQNCYFSLTRFIPVSLLPPVLYATGLIWSAYTLLRFLVHCPRTSIAQALLHSEGFLRNSPSGSAHLTQGQGQSV